MGEDVHLNEYQGGQLQQSVSALATTNQACYERSGACYSDYAVEVCSSTSRLCAF